MAISGAQIGFIGLGHMGLFETFEAKGAGGQDFSAIIKAI